MTNKGRKLQNTQNTASSINLTDTEFSLIETILWESCCGFWLLPEHLARLKSSAEHFSWQYDENDLQRQLDVCVEGLDRAPHLIRVLVNQNGNIILSVKLSSENRTAVRAGLAKQCIDVENDFIYHKTTRREIYEAATTGMSEFDEVLLWNAKGEVTESCTSNILFELENNMYTPPLSCGLLPGTLRANLLEEGSIKERSILTHQLQDCSKIYLINSAIGWREVILIS
ncbi:MAG: branched-subunit amino acid aminotransferase/4-amino-4-deoxychorismate lyase [Gammaproteobacteria bacterium]|jgi:branched-subunit amino acid aminotransferase/4-amino-4-deoxychorismate lyase